MQNLYIDFVNNREPMNNFEQWWLRKNHLAMLVTKSNMEMNIL